MIRKLLLAAWLVLLTPSLALAVWGTPTNIGTNSGSGGVATIALTGVTVPAGALIVVSVLERNATVSGSVSDTLNSYSPAPAVSLSGGGRVQAFYAYNVSALSGGTITFTKISAPNTAVISAFYVTGASTSSPLDLANSVALSATATPSLTSGTPAVPGELFVGIAGYGNTGTYIQASGWSAPPNAVIGTASALGGGNLINSGTSTQTFSPTVSAGTPSWGLIILSFEPPSSNFIFSPSVIP